MASTISSTIKTLESLPNHITAIANAVYVYGSGSNGFFNFQLGFRYNTATITTIPGTNLVDLTSQNVTSPGGTRFIEKSDIINGGPTSFNTDYTLRISNFLPNTTYYIRSYVKFYAKLDGVTLTGPYYIYGPEQTIKSSGGLPNGRGYYVSDNTIAFYDALQIKDANEGEDKVLTSDSSGLVSWKPVKSLFTFGHYIGEKYGGGIVAAVWKEADDEKVLIVSNEDLTSEEAVGQAGAEPTSIKYKMGTSNYFNNPGTANLGSCYLSFHNNAGTGPYAGGNPQNIEVICIHNFDNFGVNQANFFLSFNGTGSTVTNPGNGIGSGVYQYSTSMNKGLLRIKGPTTTNIFRVVGCGTYASFIPAPAKYIASDYNIQYVGPGTVPGTTMGVFKIYVDYLGTETTAITTGVSKNFPAAQEVLTLAYDSSGTGTSYLPVSTMTDFRWAFGAATTTSVGTLGQSPYNGYINTTNIVAQSNTLGTTYSAAKICADYRASGYDDWYLPSYYELNQVYNQAAIVNRVLNSDSLNFLNKDYWTSTEYGASDAIFFNSSNDNGYYLKSKNSTARIRAVRKESVYTGEGLVLNLDATNKKSFSDIEYLNIGSASTFKDLVNGGLTSSYSFNLSSYPIYYDRPKYFSEESGFLRFDRATIGSFQDGFIEAGSYVDFKAPVGNTTTVTVETWVRLRNGFSGGMIFGWNLYDVYCSGGSISYNSGNSDVYGVSASRVTNLNLLNNWAHYVFEMKSGIERGATPSFFSNNKIYINGNEETLYQITGNPTASRINFNSGLGRIGGWRGSDRYFINMDMSVFRVYNRALTKDEIMKNYSKEKKRYNIIGDILQNNLFTSIDFNNTSSYKDTGIISGVVTDISGNSRNATLTISGTTRVPSVITTSTLYNGRELVFPGTIETNPYLKWDDSVAFRSLQKLSVSFWIKFTASRTSEIIVKWNTTGATIGPWEIYQQLISTKNVITIRLKSSLTQVDRSGSIGIPLDRWTHVCVTYDNATKKIRTYIDSVLDIDSAAPASFSIANDISGEICVGRYPTPLSNLSYPLAGSIASIQIYDKSLSYEEVKNNYNTDKFRFDNFSDASKFISHKVNGSPTFSFSQNLFLDFVTASNDKILTMNSVGYSKLVDKTQIFTRPTNYRYIGELYGGGIIVAMWYYPKTIFNYLIMSLEDVSTGTQWSNISNGLSNAISDYNGNNNQSSIIGQVGHLSSAAKLCDDYAGGGFTDWYLPSVFEMNHAFNAAGIIDTVLGSDLLKGEYWTSTEASATTAYYYPFNSTQVIDYVPSLGYQKIESKLALNKVRAFRVATNAVITNRWNRFWDDTYTPWYDPTLDWQPGIYDSTNFDYWRPLSITTGVITEIDGNSFRVTASTITTWETVLEFGICWTFSFGFFDTSTPTINDNKVVGSGSYNSYNSIINFTHFGTYQIVVRAYVTTTTGTYYGQESYFSGGFI